MNPEAQQERERELPAHVDAAAPSVDELIRSPFLVEHPSPCCLLAFWLQTADTNQFATQLMSLPMDILKINSGSDLLVGWNFMLRRP